MKALNGRLSSFSLSINANVTCPFSSPVQSASFKLSSFFQRLCEILDPPRPETGRERLHRGILKQLARRRGFPDPGQLAEFRGYEGRSILRKQLFCGQDCGGDQ